MKKLIMALVVSLFVFAAMADEIAIDLLKGEGDVTGVRLAYRPYHTTITDFPLVGDVNLYLELSANKWRYGDPAEYDDNLAIAFSPVLTRQFTTVYGKALFWELGVGVSFLDKKRFAGKDLGSYYQFEDRLGLTLALDPAKKRSISLRYFHYSNGGLEKPNPGMDFINLSYAWRF
ncbi:acyloxyacyl hydrolase [Rheinheimera sp.]|uniref:acyloxyacyl hydrolase n=1 Tax=Rheinheimera sp. TaxID=1869214 RepID=UPI002B494026|nr:acyloxyacyl hydrolase [Rheinheimera sp.]HJS13500.1 acyloxyacyl hydrolase [Rheinheimera sp.]